MVTADDVAQHGDLRSGRNHRLEIAGCIWSTALARILAMSDFRSVDTDEPYALSDTGDHHVDGVTVHDMVHNASTG